MEEDHDPIRLPRNRKCPSPELTNYANNNNKTSKELKRLASSKNKFNRKMKNSNDR
ncbi:unnamed protein product [Sphenostylis stenocarpa]|uniref:Uncharacterized protein n=1 Tax=Sphenostylis stenocarpa TaxID=92480 RepID=A0AA86VFC6_9FABA|nr:unnamed protein product [Sphenostylis stenocarpa]